MSSSVASAPSASKPSSIALSSDLGAEAPFDETPLFLRHQPSTDKVFVGLRVVEVCEKATVLPNPWCVSDNLANMSPNRTTAYCYDAIYKLRAVFASIVITDQWFNAAIRTRQVEYHPTMDGCSIPPVHDSFAGATDCPASIILVLTGINAKTRAHRFGNYSLYF
jgi:hypothetical protein